MAHESFLENLVIESDCLGTVLKILVGDTDYSSLGHFVVPSKLSYNEI